MNNKLFNLIFLILIIIMFTTIHEATHTIINENYDCVTTGYELVNFSINTVAECNFTSIEMQSSYNLAQSIVDAVGYQLSFFAFIFIGIIMNRE